MSWLRGPRNNEKADKPNANGRNWNANDVDSVEGEAKHWVLTCSKRTEEGRRKRDGRCK